MASVKCATHHTAENKENKKETHAVEKCASNMSPNKPQQQLQLTAEVPRNKATTANRRAAGSNWQAVGAQTAEAPSEAATEPKPKTKRQHKRNKWGNRHVAMDCEMVGIGERGEKDMLARVSIVNRHGNVLLDKYVRPREKVVDYRTFVSGIRPADIEHAEEFDAVQDQVVNLLQGRVLVGHGLRKDLHVLQIKHPDSYIRDTSCYKPLARLVANGRTPSLKRLVHCLLGESIQTGEHDSVEDARAAMKIYNRCSEEWEKYLQRKSR